MIFAKDQLSLMSSFSTVRPIHVLISSQLTGELDTRHRTLGTGGHPFVLRSRSLARAILYQHLKTLDISVHSFDNTSDPRWISYLKVHRVSRDSIAYYSFLMSPQPMFALLNDGGPVEATDSPLEAECVLQQRTLIFDLISQGVSVALLEGAEFRDSKVGPFFRV